MTDIFTRLADVLHKQGYPYTGQLSKAIDALLSLPGIAIIELPRPHLDQSWRFNDSGEWEYTYVRGDDEIVVSGTGSYTVSEARELAAALLAAVNAAEAVQ